MKHAERLNSVYHRIAGSGLGTRLTIGTSEDSCHYSIRLSIISVPPSISHRRCFHFFGTEVSTYLHRCHSKSETLAHKNINKDLLRTLESSRKFQLKLLSSEDQDIITHVKERYAVNVHSFYSQVAISREMQSV